jgi:hypothetical protein
MAGCAKFGLLRRGLRALDLVGFSSGRPASGRCTVRVEECLGAAQDRPHIMLFATSPSHDLMEK